MDYDEINTWDDLTPAARRAATLMYEGEVLGNTDDTRYPPTSIRRQLIAIGLDVQTEVPHHEPKMAYPLRYREFCTRYDELNHQEEDDE